MRHDRDDFIRVIEENIDPKMKNNFVKKPYGDAGFHTAGSVDPEHTPYDVFSVIVWEKRMFLESIYALPYVLLVSFPFFSCPQQLNRWTCHSLTPSLTHSLSHSVTQ